MNMYSLANQYRPLVPHSQASKELLEIAAAEFLQAVWCLYKPQQFQITK